MHSSRPFLWTISLSSINSRETCYCLRPDHDADVNQQLQDSIGELGLLHAPLVQRRGNTYLILSGRRRIMALDSLGWRETHCLVIDEEIPAFLRWKTLLAHALIGSQLSPIEQAYFFAKAGQELDEKNLLAFLPILGHKPNPQLLGTFSRALALVPAAIKALHHGHVRPRSVDLLHKCHPHDQVVLVDLIETFRIGGSKQRNLILLGLDLTKRLEKPLKEIIRDWNRERTSKDGNNRPQQAAELFKWLMEKQAPRHQQAKQEFRSFVRKMKLPTSCSLSPTSSFEDEQLSLTIRFPDQDSFCRHWKAMRPVLENTHE